jgi:purine-nucleoside phosphorylase
MQDGQLLGEATARVASLCPVSPRVAIILGSGLGGLAQRLDASAVIPYQQIPGFVNASAGGHRGELILGRLEGVSVVAMSGRFHRYEGWSIDQIVFPVRLMHTLGARTLVVSNAAGGLNPAFRVGDIVVIRDHINWLGNPDSIWAEPPTRFADWPPAAVAVAESIRRGCETYDFQLAELAKRIARERGFDAYDGTYLATLGPNYETRSEYRMMRRMGVDIVGMSTVPEVLTAGALRMRTLGLSMVSNVANPDRPVQADHNEVLAAGRTAATKLEAIVRAVVRHVSSVDAAS